MVNTEEFLKNLENCDFRRYAERDKGVCSQIYFEDYSSELFWEYVEQYEIHPEAEIIRFALECRKDLDGIADKNRGNRYRSAA